MKPNISELIVQKDQCIGCGVCSAICPIDILPMGFNNIGLYQPFEQDGCLNKCTLCIDVCPFITLNQSEQDLSKSLYKDEKNKIFHTDLGYFVSTYEVHKKDLNDRLKSASGGAGHAILKELLDSEKIDVVLSVEPHNDAEKLFKFSVFSNSLELENIRGSVYYPTELSEVLEYVLKNDGRYAVTVLPCYAKAIRLAQEKNYKLRKRIKYLVGLVCGQMKTKEFTTQLSKNVIGDKPLASVRYRVKQEKENANNYAFEFKSKDGSVGLLGWASQIDGPSKMWGNRMFTPIACNSCTDVFAYVADIVIMDAWLPEYIKDYSGHTLIIIRTHELDEILKNMITVNINKIDYQKVFNSQKKVVDNKNSFAKRSKNIVFNAMIDRRVQIQKLSLKNYNANKYEIEKLILEIKKLNKLNRIMILPKKIILKIQKLIKYFMKG